MSNNDTLLQYYVTLNWAREFVSDIDNGAAKFQMITGNGNVTDMTLNIREQQLRVIEILDDLVENDHQQSDRRIHRVQ